MEQYLNLVWKNYTASLTDDSDDNDDTADLFVHNNLHYNVPFWVGATVITVFILSVIIATIRYCIYTFCSSSNDTEKLVSTPPRSPNCSSSQHRRCQTSDTISHHLSDETEVSSCSAGRSRDHCSDISSIPIIRHRTEFEIDNEKKHQFPSKYIDASRTHRDYPRKIHDIYVLPVSPSLSSSSSTAHTDDTIRTGSNTMPIRFQRHSPRNQSDSPYCGVKNVGFADSPQLKTRTLPRSHYGTLQQISAPPQPPPLPPPLANLSSSIVLDPDTIDFRFHRSEEKPVTQLAPPPIPSRSQKPTILSIQFDEIEQQQSETSPQDDLSEHTWPNPPESLTTSQISGALFIPYDHLIPAIITHPYRPTEHSILSSSHS
ncbi:unnamed protein product [Adineta ricciae]|uniref:Uncharacterized protein n=1 Tax=Adineta ricciae TaxID=249248 RepID=A0A813SLX9_ADIRI|nr:unnamed protein product [Adineta ricciae]